MKHLLPLAILTLAFSLSLAADKPATDGLKSSDGLPLYLEPGKKPDEYRNVALNPSATADEKPTSYPHATTNSQYNNKEFAARCAIDGKTENKDVHKCGSWGPQKQADLWWKLDLGRPVEIDKAIIYVRAAFGHDSFWKSGTIEFSDKSKLDFQLKKTADPQEIKFEKRTVTWLKITNLIPEEPKWCAFAEIQIWGR